MEAGGSIIANGSLSVLSELASLFVDLNPSAGVEVILK